ncbi:response regulator [Brevibacillus laterosporus]|uniref:response regulator n=1 Tax=Brevibacillus laterosporus TaxID=1465 RepID=UPI003D219C0E
MNSKLELLVVEDNEVHQYTIKKVLEKRTDIIRKIKIVKNTREVLNILKKEYFNSLLLDYQLRSETALDVLEAISKEGYKVPSVILTNDAQHVDEIKAKKLGCFRVFDKFGYYGGESVLDRSVMELMERAKYKDFMEANCILVPACIDGTIIQIPAPEILTICSTYLGRVIYTETGLIETNLNFKVYEQYSYPQFARAAKDHVVNLSKVEVCDSKYRFIILEKNIHVIEKIEIPRTNREKFKLAWELYKGMN